MNFTLWVSELAEADLIEAIAYYQGIRPSLADELELRTKQIMDRVLENPNAFPKIHGNARRALMRQFPYSVIFQIRNDRVEVEAVFHGSRAPGRLRNRIG
jgi:plasmid stabilization system protein ParE